MPDMPGFGFPVRYRIEVSDTADFQNPRTVVDRTAEDQPNPGVDPVVLTFPTQDARTVRVTATRLRRAADDNYYLSMVEMEVSDAAGNNLALGKAVSVKNGHENLSWSNANLVDGQQRPQKEIRHSPMFRKTFRVAKPVARARAYASGLQYNELHLNGARIGDRVLDPANTVFEKTTLYSTYDVTDRIRQGENGVGLMVGHGWNGNVAGGWLQLRIEYADGTSETIVTDTSWRWSSGPVVEESLYDGETYDARLEKAGWDTAGYDDSTWIPAAKHPAPPAAMRAEAMQPIRVNGTRAAESIVKRPEGSYIVDFGQNLTGWVRLDLEAAAGTSVTIKHAELLHADGSLNPENLRAAKATDTYVAKGGAMETYEPRFTQHGFRYAEVIGYPGELTADRIEARIVHTDFKRTGWFDSSDDLFNGIYRLTLWSIVGNAMSIPTDCPQRDERKGWTGDAHLAAETVLMNYDAVPFYENWLRVLADSQAESGEVPDVAPHYGRNIDDGSPSWAAAYILVTWYLYHYAGDVRPVQEHYGNLVRWFGTLERHAKDNILEYNRYGDWVGVEQTQGDPISTGYYYWAAKILEEFAGVLGKNDDAARFRDRQAQIAQAFNAQFFDKEKGFYGNGTQYAQIWPLYLGIVPEGARASVLAHLKSEIADKRQGHLATGILGTKYAYTVLPEFGMNDLAYRVTQQKDYPSYGYMMANGATTLWELWENKTGNDMNSHNHVMFGSVVGWLMGDVAGLNTLPEGGYRHFTIAPMPGGGLTGARARIDTVRGPVACEWKQVGDGLDMHVSVPPNTEATFVVPVTGGREVSLVRNENTSAGDMPAAVREPQSVTYQLGSGHYSVEVR